MTATTVTVTCARLLNQHDPDSHCGGNPAGFTVTIYRADVDRLLAGEESRAGLYPVAYCAEHLQELEEAHAAARQRGGHSPQVAALLAGQAIGVLWLEPR